MAEGKLIFALYDGFVVAETAKAVGFGPEPDGRAQLWIPKSRLGEITYLDDGDSDEIEMRAPIEAIQIPRWLAAEEELEIDE